MQGKSVKLFLVDGEPTGLLTVEIMNWTGHALVCPRSQLHRALARDEASRTGVYFLVGEDPERPSRLRVYIGEGDNVGERLKTHARDANKEFWTKACIFTSKDANLTKAHVRYLEHRFVDLARQADRSTIMNGNEPAKKLLPESDVADMEYFVSQVEVVLPVLGLEFLRSVRAIKAQGTPAEPALAEPVELILTGPHGHKARALELNGEVTVLKGSTASVKTHASNTYGALREQLVKDGRLKRVGNFLEFVEDVPFESPSAAAAVVHNRNANGRTAWKIDGTGLTLKEWQDAKLDIS